MDPAHAEAHFHLGNIFLSMNELGKALEHFERVKAIDTNYQLIDANIQNIKAKMAEGEKRR